jgi:hypothetical protein
MKVITIVLGDEHADMLSALLNYKKSEYKEVLGVSEYHLEEDIMAAIVLTVGLEDRFKKIDLFV